MDDRTNSVRVGTGYHLRFFSDHDFSLSYMRSDTDAHSASADATQAEWNFGWAARFETLPLVLEAGLGNSDTDYPFDGIHVDRNLTIELASKSEVPGLDHAPILQAMEIVRQ